MKAAAEERRSRTRPPKAAAGVAPPKYEEPMLPVLSEDMRMKLLSWGNYHGSWSFTIEFRQEIDTATERLDAVELQRYRRLMDSLWDEYKAIEIFISYHFPLLWSDLPQYPATTPSVEEGERRATAFRKIAGQILHACSAQDVAETGDGHEKKKGKRPVHYRNAERDSYVARQRSKKNPPSWEEILDDVNRMAAPRGWDPPGSAKALSEAYSRYVKRQRKLGADQ